MAIEDFFITEFTVRRLTGAQDAMGGEAGTWSDASAGNLCRMRSLTMKEREMLGREGVVSTHHLYCATSVDVTEKDRIRIGSTDYDVTGVNTRQDAEGDHHYKIYMTLRR